MNAQFRMVALNHYPVSGLIECYKVAAQDAYNKLNRSKT